MKDSTKIAQEPNFNKARKKKKTCLFCSSNKATEYVSQSHSSVITLKALRECTLVSSPHCWLMVRYVGYFHQNIHLEYQAIKPHIVFPQELSHFSRFSVCSDEKRLQWQREDTALMSCVSKHGVGSGLCMLVCLCATPSIH